MTDFAVTGLQETAMRSVQEHEIMLFSARDRETFVADLLEAIESGDLLKNAYRWYQQRMGKLWGS